MFWRKTKIIAVDLAAVLAGLLLATPFVMILVAPFIGGD